MRFVSIKLFLGHIENEIAINQLEIFVAFNWDTHKSEWAKENEKKREKRIISSHNWQWLFSIDAVSIVHLVACPIQYGALFFYLSIVTLKLKLSSACTRSNETLNSHDNIAQKRMNRILESSANTNTKKKRLREKERTKKHLPKKRTRNRIKSELSKNDEVKVDNNTLNDHATSHYTPHTNIANERDWSRCQFSAEE